MTEFNWKRFTLVMGVVFVSIASFVVSISILDNSVYSVAGVKAVYLMYDFSSPAELAKNQAELANLLLPSEFDRLTVDEPLRTVNAYHKFGYAPSSVSVVAACEGMVLYRIVNDNISFDTLWLFLYEEDADGRLFNIREYRLVASGESED